MFKITADASSSLGSTGPSGRLAIFSRQIAV